MLNERDWMDTAEAQTLAGLLAAFWSTGGLPRPPTSHEIWFARSGRSRSTDELSVVLDRLLGELGYRHLAPG